MTAHEKLLARRQALWIVIKSIAIAVAGTAIVYFI
jgi:hypothetical protein